MGSRGASSFKTTTRRGFGEYSKDNIPVYNSKIDYTGDFSNANLTKLSNKQLTEALNKQSELYERLKNENLGDQRTRNGKMNAIFNKAEKGKRVVGMQKLNEEMQKRNMPRYNIYNQINNALLVSSPTKEMAQRQLIEMYRTDKSLGKTYKWKEFPKYTIKKETKGQVRKRKSR